MNNVLISLVRNRKEYPMKGHTLHGLWAPEVLAKGHGTAAYLVPALEYPEVSWTDGTNLKPLTDRCQEELPSGGRIHDQPLQSHEPLRTTSRRPGILVVDDDVGVRILLNAVLWQNGFRVWLVGDGLQALELYPEERPDIDLVLLDVQMPGLDGPHTLAALQRLNPAICCCLMNGGSGPYTEEELLDQGAIHVLQKPFHLTALVHLLWQLVDAATAQAADREARGTSGGTLSELFLG
jgi:CheY-like chemotaxis protein